MNFKHEAWPVKKLVELYEAKKLELNPPYQRNPIWSSAAQKELIESILRGRPMPSFFLLARANGTFEVVDGKQRALTIFAFWRGQLAAKDGRNIDSVPAESGELPLRHIFLSYSL